MNRTAAIETARAAMLVSEVESDMKIVIVSERVAMASAIALDMMIVAVTAMGAGLKNVSVNAKIKAQMVVFASAIIASLSNVIGNAQAQSMTIVIKIVTAARLTNVNVNAQVRSIMNVIVIEVPAGLRNVIVINNKVAGSRTAIVIAKVRGIMIVIVIEVPAGLRNVIVINNKVAGSRTAIVIAKVRGIMIECLKAMVTGMTIATVSVMVASMMTEGRSAIITSLWVWIDLEADRSDREAEIINLLGSVCCRTVMTHWMLLICNMLLHFGKPGSARCQSGILSFRQ
jgi:hypothetical protein